MPTVLHAKFLSEIYNFKGDNILPEIGRDPVHTAKKGHYYGPRNKQARLKIVDSMARGD